MRISTSLMIVAGLSLAACSAEESDPAAQADRRVVPEETARLLSLGGHLIGNDQTAFEMSLNCATSLRVTANALQALRGQASPAEVAMIGRAADVYEDRAVASSDGPSEREIRARVARDAAGSKDDRSEQAQLAIVCLRSLG